MSRVVKSQACLCIIVALIFSTSAFAIDLTGKVHIIDGDTVRIGKTKIRLHGIDAPETKQTCLDHTNTPYMCGKASTASLRKLIGPSLVVHCKGTHHDRYKRLIAVCFTGGIDLNAEMVRQGWAVAYRKYSTDYVKTEVKAQKAKRGMWAGTFQMPWLWRMRPQRRTWMPDQYYPTVTFYIQGETYREGLIKEGQQHQREQL
ncbi:MAG: hypothetical protein COB46_13100 [Rhodospirillaceae bacterium]|nr:MAG: hypothetical protein COB46_13100 [Rhodospirillaceae bacterium]